jgi:signal transduction histidine kinase
VDAGGRLVFLNSAWRLLQAENEDEGSHRRSVPAFRVDGSTASKSDYAITRALTGESVKGSEIILQFGDEKRVWLRTSASPIIDESGATIGAIASSQDITKLRLLEMEHERSSVLLQERVQQLELIISSMTDGVLIVDVDGNTVLCNDVFEGIVGPRFSAVPPAERWGILNVRDWSGNPIGTADSMVGQALQGNRITNAEILVRGQDGQDVYLRVSGGPLLHPGETVAGAVFLVRDETAAIHALREREAFLSLVAHELRTPTTLIRGYTQLVLRTLEMDPNVDPVTRERVQIIDRRTEQLTDLISQLVDVNRLESGAFTIRPEAIPYRQALDSICTESATLTDRSRIRFDGGPDITVPVDILRVQQVITNLIDNALKHGPDGQTVRIWFDTTDSEVRTYVEDQGDALPQAERERIFDRFYQVQPEGSKTHQGMGLGLFICRGIIEAHGGRIWADEAPKSRFAFSLPLVSSAS